MQFQVLLNLSETLTIWQDYSQDSTSSQKNVSHNGIKADSQ